MIKEPGIYDISNADYHADPALNKSGLSELLKSPLHFQYSRKNKREETEAMKIGTATHVAILEPEELPKQYAATIKIEKRSKAGKEAFKLQQDNLSDNGLIGIETPTYERILAMRDAVHNNKTAAKLLKNGIAEKSVFWRDKLGFMCKVRPDWLPGNDIIVDLKTTKDASPDGFPKECANYNYALQAVFYCSGLTAATGKEHNPENFLFIAVESAPPHGVGIYHLNFQSIDFAKTQLRKLRLKYDDCLKNEIYPGYKDQLTSISLPPWTLKLKD